MRLIRKLDAFILKSYLLLFAGTFFICLFIFMMQFMWRYVEELIGKGLSWDVLGKFFYYSGLTLVPMSLPLAILLASLISFGNLGEKFELLSMKAAGVPLVRILQPVFCFVLLVCGGSFYFQNKIGPEATKQLATLIWSMKQKSPELEIPEGIFYNEIPGYNLFVEHKDPDTGMLYGVMIYNNTNSYEDAQIVLADSARLQSTADKMHLKLTLFNGERFRNMESQSGSMLRANVPYMRESFITEVDLIPFDGNFNMMDASLFAGNAATKKLPEIVQGIDSLTVMTDSIGHAVASNARRLYLERELPSGLQDSAAIVQETAESRETLDSIYARLTEEKRTAAWRNALRKAQFMQSEYDFRGTISADNNLTLRKHKIEANRKFTLSLACLLFFFIGAPLGAII
ncbi:MAG: LptF/LptG family permease, partial [Bacteroidaceae bacterium]|nr:LptF/LptG family permease [Bacteroidaceae bacterium]